MTNETLTEEEILNYMAEYLIVALDELTDTKTGDGFINGEITAFVECLEMINLWKGFARFGITDIEKKYKIE